VNGSWKLDLRAFIGSNEVTREHSRGRPILLIDDNSDVLEAITHLLLTSGYKVVTARDGEEALQLLNDGLNPGAILLDLMMPGIDGYEFRRRQIADVELRSIPTIIYSGYRDVAKASRELGETVHLYKSGRLPSLLDTIAKYCK
jgi:CheY-like chemotaxis protein